jgi:hypothetical protein
MAKDVGLSDLLRLRAEKARELAELDDIISGVRRFTGAAQGEPRNGGPRRRKARSSRTSTPKTQTDLLPPEGSVPTVREAVTRLVAEEPGIRVSEAIRRLTGVTAIGSADPRKTLSTRFAQFVARGQLRRVGDQLYLPE